jgi:hypothetical protein
MKHQIIQDFNILAKKFPGIVPEIFRSEFYYVQGNLPVIDANGYCWEKYDVKIALYDQYPNVLPMIWETGGKITRTADWHVNNNGSLCVGTDVCQYHTLAAGITLLDWIEKLAIPYLANHKLKLDKGNYSNVERSHGWMGVYEEYAELFNISSKNKLLERLRLCSDRAEMSRNISCFCGSGRKYKRCYLLHPEAHRLHVPKMLVWKHIDEIMKLRII